VLHVFWSFSALSLFVGFLINQVPSNSKTESHIFLFDEQNFRRFALAAGLVNPFSMVLYKIALFKCFWHSELI